MTGEQTRWRQVCLTCGVLTLLLVQRPAVARTRTVWASPVQVVAVETTAQGAPGVGRSVHRMFTRAEHFMGRFGSVFGQVVLVWLSILASAVLFLLVAAVSSVADFRIFDLRRNGPGAVSRYLGYGMRTFFRLLMDRRTPFTARSVLALALIYWLMPLDLIADTPLLPGFLDDLLIAILAAKSFVYLCPDSVVTAAAAAVQPSA